MRSKKWKTGLISILRILALMVSGIGFYLVIAWLLIIADTYPFEVLGVCVIGFGLLMIFFPIKRDRLGHLSFGIFRPNKESNGNSKDNSKNKKLLNGIHAINTREQIRKRLSSFICGIKKFICHNDTHSKQYEGKNLDYRIPHNKPPTKGMFFFCIDSETALAISKIRLKRQRLLSMMRSKGIIEKMKAQFMYFFKTLRLKITRYL